MKLNWKKLPDLGEAWIAAVHFNGPVDPALIKRKREDNVKDAKERRELEANPLSPLVHAREERADRERKDRDHQNFTLTVLLASNAAYRAVYENAIVAFAAAGNAIDDAIEAGEKALADVTDKIEDYLASTPRLKDGRYVMFDAKDGVYRDQNFEVIGEKDLAGVDKDVVKPILPYERMMEWKAKVAAELDKQFGRSLEVGGWQDEATNDRNPTRQDMLEERTERSSDYEKDAREAQKQLSATPELFAERAHGGLREGTERVAATMAMPQLP